jgi:UDP-glucuronate 4-epimerase
MEEALDITAKKIMLPMQDGDVQRTWANVDQLLTITNYCPKTNIKTGIKQFVDWYKQFKSRIR